jgi:hypothetical protein
MVVVTIKLLQVLMATKSCANASILEVHCINMLPFWSLLYWEVKALALLSQCHML